VYCSSPIAINTSGTVINTNIGQGVYKNGQHCYWRIVAAPDQVVTLSFSAFYTEGCCDPFAVYDGASAASPLIWSKTGSTIPGPVVSTGNTLYVTFGTDGSVVYSGVVATVTFIPLISINSAFCSAPATINASGAVLNTNAAVPTYNNGESCAWVISAPANQTIVLTFSKFDTQSGADFFSVYDGALLSATRVLRTSGSAGPAPIFSSTSSMTVTFNSDGSVVGGGVIAKVTFISNTSNAGVPNATCSSPGNLTSNGTVIDTNVGGGNYSNFQSCTWTISAPPDQVITFTFARFAT